MGKLVVALLVGFVLYQVAGRVWLGQMYSTVTARAQRNNDIHFEQPPEWKRSFDQDGFPSWNKQIVLPGQEKHAPPYAGSHR